MKTQDKKNSVLDVFFNSAVFITIITGLLYLHGDAFRRGYLRAFGIDSNLFPLAFEKTLLAGFQAFVLLGLKAVMPLLLFVLVFVIFFLGLDFARKKAWFQKVVSLFIKQDASNEDEKFSLFDLALVFFLNMCFLLLLIIGLLLTAIYAENIALSQGVRNREKMDSVQTQRGLRNREMLAVIEYELSSEKPATIVGHIIDSSESMIAIYSAKRVTILPKSKMRNLVITDMVETTEKN